MLPCAMRCPVLGQYRVLPCAMRCPVMQQMSDSDLARGLTRDLTWRHTPHVLSLTGAVRYNPSAWTDIALCITRAVTLSKSGVSESDSAPCYAGALADGEGARRRQRHHRCPARGA
eukprot:209124-Rhodomonas_salina.1